MNRPRQQPRDFSVIDAFHALIDGRKVRLYPGTGKNIDPAGLGINLTWAGDNIGVGENEIVTLVDENGNWTVIPAADVQTHSVWNRIDSYGRKRIAEGLEFGRTS